MPYCEISTNVSIATKVETDKCVLAVSKCVSEHIQKPEKWVMVRINANQSMSYSGTTEPCAFVRLVSIGNLGEARNKVISQNLCSLLKDTLQISPDRVYIDFKDVEKRYMFGWNSGTFWGLAAHRYTKLFNRVDLVEKSRACSVLQATQNVFFIPFWNPTIWYQVTTKTQNECMSINTRFNSKVTIIQAMYII